MYTSRRMRFMGFYNVDMRLQKLFNFIKKCQNYPRPFAVDFKGHRHWENHARVGHDAPRLHRHIIKKWRNPLNSVSVI